MRKAVFGVATVSALLLASPAAAQDPPADPPPQVARENRDKPAAMLASAEIHVPADQPKEASEEPAKRPRARRVTSCRCGDEAAPQ